MKRRYILLTILVLLCAYPARAVTASSPYQAYTAGYSSAPRVAMRSTSSMMPTRSTSSSYSAPAQRSYGASMAVTTAPTRAYRNMMNNAVPVRGIQTSATMVRGGMTAGQTYAAMSRPRRTSSNPEHPDEPEDCEYCHDDNGDGNCDHCGCPMDDCNCADDPEGPGYCWCPIEFDWTVMAFIALLACAYLFYKRKPAFN